MRAVLLDAMGTLLTIDPPAPRLRAALAERGTDVSEDAAGAALRAEIHYYRAHHDEAHDRPSLDDLRDRCAEILRAALPEHARATPDLRGALLDALRFVPYPDVPPALAALRAAGLRLVVVSNWDVSLHDALAATGLDQQVDAALSSAEARSSKPGGAIFAQALALAGVDGRDRHHDAVAHVGDSAEHDVAGALAAGLRPILVARHGERPPAGVTAIPTLAQLPAALGLQA